MFTQEALLKLQGHYGIGHCNYPVSGSAGRSAAQPFYSNYPYSLQDGIIYSYGLSLGFNGGLINGVEVKKHLLKNLRCINTNCVGSICVFHCRMPS